MPLIMNSEFDHLMEKNFELKWDIATETIQKMSHGQKSWFEVEYLNEILNETGKALGPVLLKIATKFAIINGSALYAINCSEESLETKFFIFETNDNWTHTLANANSVAH